MGYQKCRCGSSLKTTVVSDMKKRKWVTLARRQLLSTYMGCAQERPTEEEQVADNRGASPWCLRGRRLKAIQVCAGRCNIWTLVILMQLAFLSRVLGNGIGKVVRRSRWLLAF